MCWVTSDLGDIVGICRQRRRYWYSPLSIVLEVGLGISDRMPRFKRCYLFVTVILKTDACCYF